MDGKGCRPPSPSGPCCDVKSNNGGFWTFNPTSAGKLLLELWLAALWQDSVVERKIWAQIHGWIILREISGRGQVGQLLFEYIPGAFLGTTAHI